MKIELEVLTSNEAILNRARTTVWKTELSKEPSEKFLDNIYMSEHSPIRIKEFVVKITGIKSWIATHLCRHSIGYTPFVSTQRDDRTPNDIPRDELPQGALVNVDILLNAQSFINVSKARLCGASHKETTAVWLAIVDELSKVAPELSSKCVPTCIYRGFCPESICCGKVGTKSYKEWRKIYVGNRPTCD